MYLNNPRISFFSGHVLNYVYTAAALLDRLPYIHSYFFCSCSRSCRVSDIVVPIKCYLVMRLITFTSLKLKTLMDFQMFWLLWRSTWETEGQASLRLKISTQASYLRCYWNYNYRNKTQIGIILLKSLTITVKVPKDIQIYTVDIFLRAGGRG